MKSFLRVLVLIAIVALPIMASAALDSLDEGFRTIMALINSYIIPLIIGIGGLYFMWGVVQYVTAGDSEDKKSAGRSMMIYGIIALFVMISVWGLVNLLSGTFDLEENLPSSEIPKIPSAN